MRAIVASTTPVARFEEGKGFCLKSCSAYRLWTYPNEQHHMANCVNFGGAPSTARAFDTTVLHDYSYDLFHPGLFEKSLIRSWRPAIFFWVSTCYWPSLRAISEAPRLFFACSGFRGYRDACSIVHPKSYTTDKVRVQEVFAAFRVLKSVHWRRR